MQKPNIETEVYDSNKITEEKKSSKASTTGRGWGGKKEKEKNPKESTEQVKTSE